MVVLIPLTPSRFISCSLQKDVLEPPSRKAYVCTVVSPPLALTFTGTTGSPVTEPPTTEKAHCSLLTLTYALWVPMSAFRWEHAQLVDAGMSNACRRNHPPYKSSFLDTRQHNDRGSSSCSKALSLLQSDISPSEVFALGQPTSSLTQWTAEGGSPGSQFQGVI